MVDLEDKIISLLEKMYNEMNDMRKDIKSNNDHMGEMRKEIKNNNDHMGEMRKDIKSNNDHMGEMRKDIKSNSDQMNEMRKDIKSNSDEIRQVQKNLVRLENNITPKIKSLFDGYVQNTEMLYRIESKVDNLANKVERQEVEIKVIKGAR